MKSFNLIFCLLVFSTTTISNASDPQCIVWCENRIPDDNLIKALTSSEAFHKNGESNINCFDPKLYCNNLGLDCAKLQMPNVSWFKSIKDGMANPLKSHCSPNNRLIIGDMPKGLLWGEGRFEILWPHLKKTKKYFYKAVSGE